MRRQPASARAGSLASRVARAAAGVVVLSIAVLAAALLATDPAREPIPESAIAVVDGRPFTADELRTRTGIQRFTSEAAIREAIEALAVGFLLEREADRRGAASGDTRGLVRVLVEEAGGYAPVRDADLRAFYDAHRERYVAPRQVRIAFVRAGWSDDREAAREAIRVAQTLTRMSLTAGRSGLAAPDVSAVSSGEVGPVSCQEPGGSLLPAPAIQRACELARGAVSTVLESDEAFWVVRKIAEYPARHLSFEQVRPWIRDELRADARRAAHRAVRQRLLENARIQVPDDLVARLPIERPAPNEEPASNGPPAPPGGGVG